LRRDGLIISDISSDPIFTEPRSRTNSVKSSCGEASCPKEDSARSKNKSLEDFANFSDQGQVGIKEYHLISIPSSVSAHYFDLFRASFKIPASDFAGKTFVKNTNKLKTTIHKN